jgi:polar amino acid transport system substrate-binding protein
VTRRTGRWPLAGVLVLALFAGACAEEQPTGGGGGGGGGATPEPEFTTLEEGVLQVASCLDFPPFEAVKGGDEVGFDVDLAEEIGARLGLEVQWVRADFDTVFTAIAANQFDMVAAAVTSTGELGQERDQIVDFSDPYFNSRQSLAVNVQETPDIASTADIGEGDVIGVQRGTTGKAWAEDNLAPQGAQLKTFNLIPDAFRDLEAGNVTGVINDEPGSVGIIEDLGLEGTVEIVEAIDTNEKYSFVFSPDNPELLEAANQALAEIIQDGTYATIFERYFPGVEVPPEYAPSA